MKVLLQRVRHAMVRVDDLEVSRIGRGLLAFVGVEHDDGPEDVSYFADKTAEIRLFPDEDGTMNRGLEEIGGAVLVVSQFTLAASTRRGRRPSYSRAAPPERARQLYEQFIDHLRRRGLDVAAGVFQARMEVELVNEGPVTILLEPRGHRSRLAEEAGS